MKEVKIFFAGDFCCKPSTARVSVSDELKDLISSCDVKVLTFEAPLKPEASQLPEQKRERFYQNDDAPAFLRGIRYNDALCQSLVDPTLYQEKLAACRNIAVKKDIPFIDHTFHDYGLRGTVRQLVKYVFKYLFNRPRGGSAELSYLLKNDTRRKLTERFL